MFEGDPKRQQADQERPFLKQLEQALSELHAVIENDKKFGRSSNFLNTIQQWVGFLGDLKGYVNPTLDYPGDLKERREELLKHMQMFKDNIADREDEKNAIQNLFDIVTVAVEAPQKGELQQLQDKIQECSRKVLALK